MGASDTKQVSFGSIDAMTAAPKRKIGRPKQDPATNDAAKAEIIAGISAGIPLAEICRRPGMPTISGVHFWRDQDPAFAERFGRARDAGYDVIAADCLRIADTPLIGEEETEKPSGVEVKRGDMLGHRRLQIETRLKLLAKWDPRRYGDKLALGGADDLPPLKTMTDEQLEARIAALQAKANAGKD